MSVVFSVTVRNAQAQPLPGIGLRLLDSNGVDVTASRFGSSPVYTDASGVFLRTYSGTQAELAAQSIAPGNYVIVGVGPGYYQNNVLTGDNFTGFGSFSLDLPAIPGGSASGIVKPESEYVSPLGPVEFTVTGVALAAPWEYIEATVTNKAGEASVIEVPVIDGMARLNLQARLELEPDLFLVGDSAKAVIDGGFSDRFNITLASLTSTGRQPLDNIFTLGVANAFPDGETNDLTHFTNDGDWLADWLTPWDELPKFAGHYADATVWLPIPGGLEYALQIEYQRVNRDTLETISIPLPPELFSEGKAVRIRIPEPIAGAQYAILTVFQDGFAQTSPLTVRYEHG